MFLTNLPLTVTEAAIRELAKEQLDGDEADIEEIRLIRDPRGRVKGFAYLQLRDKSLVPTAITKLNNQKL